MNSTVARYLKNPFNLFYNPHQKFWIMDVFLNLGKLRFLYLPIVLLDSMILWIQSMITRVKLLGISKLFITATDQEIVFVDIGLHQEAEELEFFEKEFGTANRVKYVAIEADDIYKEGLLKKYSYLGDRIKFHFCAVVGPEFQGNEITFYRAGKASSLFAERNHDGEVTVPCKPLSRIIQSELEQELKGNSLFILRMNCEGAEWDILRDLEQSHLIHRFAGLFGMWDDLWKIDPKKDKLFRMYLKTLGLKNLSFNDRDLMFRFRQKLITFHITTMLCHYDQRSTAQD